MATGSLITVSNLQTNQSLTLKAVNHFQISQSNTNQSTEPVARYHKSNQREAQLASR